MSDSPKIAAFAYHDVTDQPDTTGFQRPAAMAYKLPVAVFRRHLDAIADGPQPPRLITEIDFGGGGHHLVVTVDDGARSAVTAAEELGRRGWKAHFFVTTERLGTRRFLDAAAVRDIHAAGHLVGTHSHTHPDIFRDLSDERMRSEWRDSCRCLEDITGGPTVAASVPGGDASARVCRSAADAGLQYLFTSDPTLDPERVDGCWVVGRYCPKVRTDVGYIRRLARFEAWGWALLVRRVKDLGRWALPGVYRAYVRRATRERSAGPADADHTEATG